MYPSSPSSNPSSHPLAWNFAQDFWAYWVDACQRSLLFVDALQQRSSVYHEHAAKLAPHVLRFSCELIMDGRKLRCPVNYALVRIIPPAGVEIDQRKRPFVIVDPRAGHGPGIGGFKPDSEIGVALKAGHPCYFVGFLPEPMPGQTIEDVAEAEAAFLERVIARHPDAEGKPAVVGNCQAGWAVMLLASMRPELFGPVIVAGAPLSYWSGIRGQNPMRYTGGLSGGSWLTALVGDLGNGRFDGALLVTNFENLNPSNTLWSKQYNLYRNIDTEVPRYLEFERWWGGHVLLNACEMQFIVDELFVGNKLATAEITSKSGVQIDPRKIRSPIVVFCSKGDNITPPQQALGWILDLYQNVDDIRSHGQTIVYAVHETIGHLGIFVSGSVAKKEHDEFASNIDLIDALPPGLYEAVMQPKDAGAANADLVAGDYLVRFEARSLDDIRAMGGNTDDDDREFAAVARVSEINLGLYRTFLQPWIRAWTSEAVADALRQSHSSRAQYELFAESNPFLSLLNPYVQWARENRAPVDQNNAFWQAQEQFSDWMVKALDCYRDTRDKLSEELFHLIYGSPLVQALAGLKASDARARRHPGDDAEHKALVARRIEELRAAIPAGGPREALIRVLLYVRQPEGAADERGFNFLRRLREQAGEGLTLTEFKQLVREQFTMLLLDERRAIEAIPEMIAKDPDLAPRLAAALKELITIVGVDTPEGKARLARMETLIKSISGPVQPKAIEASLSQQVRSPKSG